MSILIFRKQETHGSIFCLSLWSYSNCEASSPKWDESEFDAQGRIDDDNRSGQGGTDSCCHSSTRRLQTPQNHPKIIHPYNDPRPYLNGSSIVLPGEHVQTFDQLATSAPKAQIQSEAMELKMRNAFKSKQMSNSDDLSGTDKAEVTNKIAQIQKREKT